MSALLALVHVLAVATPLDGEWACDPVGPAFVSVATVHSSERTIELVDHDDFIVQLEGLTISEALVSVEMTYRDMNFAEVSATHLEMNRLAFMVPVKTGPDLKTFSFTAIREGQKLRVEAVYPLSIGVRNFGGVVGPDKIIGDYALAGAVYDCQMRTAK